MRLTLASWVGAWLALAAAIVAMNAAPAGAADADVSVGQGGNLFAPTTVTVNVGDMVTWNWVGGFHSVVAVDGSFNSGAYGTPGDPFQVTFDTAGTFFYYCDVHAPASAANDEGIAAGQMVGKVVVQAAAQETTTPTATATATASPTGTAAATATATGTATGTATPRAPTTGQGGMAGTSGSPITVMLLGALAVAVVAGARVASERHR